MRSQFATRRSPAGIIWGKGRASHGQLGSEDGGTAPDTIFQDLQQGEPGRAIKVLETKIVKDDHIGSGDLVDLFEIAAIGHPEPGLREELGAVEIAGLEAVQTRLMADS